MDGKIAAILDNAKSGASAIGKQPIDEILISRIRNRAAEVLRREVVTFAVAIGIVGCVAGTIKEATTLLRRPGEAGVEIENAIDLKSAKCLAYKISAMAEERDVPQPGKNKIVTNIKIRWPTIESLIAGIALLGPSSERAGVNALTPTINALHLEATGVRRVARKSIAL